MSQYITGHFKKQKDTFCQGNLHQDNLSKCKNDQIYIVEDILNFPKSLISPSKYENWESYDQCKLGNFEEMHEVQSEQTWNFELVGLTFDVQTCSQCVKGPLSWHIKDPLSWHT